MVTTVLDQDLTNLNHVIAMLQGQPQDFTAEDFHSWFRPHNRWVASDHTPGQVAFTNGVTAYAFPLKTQLPIYQAELLAALAATSIAKGTYTLFVDNISVRYNLDKGRCPAPWLYYMLHVFANRSFAVRHMVSECNPADLFSRVVFI